MRRYIQYVYINYCRIPWVIFHEKMDFNTAAEGLGESGGRALWAMIYKTHNYKEVGLNTLENYFILM